MGVGIGLGLAASPFSSADGYWEWVRMCDQEGVESIWQTDRLVSKEPFLECMSAMAALAGATKKIKFGMNVASIGLRDPLLTAKQCATIDYLSNGRLLPAFGLGSNRSRDWVASGRDTKARGQRMNEALEVMTRLWSEESVSFEGKHFQYDDVTVSPRPAQKELPLWIGGSSDAAIDRTARFGTGWQAASDSPEKAGEVVEKILIAAKQNGRPMDPDHMGIGFGVRFGTWEEESVQRAAKAFEKTQNKPAEQGMAVGDANTILRRIEDYTRNGVAKFILRPIAVGDADAIGQTERLIAEVLPHARELDDRLIQPQV